MNSSDRIAVQRYAAAYDGLSTTDEQAVRRAEDLRAGEKRRRRPLGSAAAQVQHRPADRISQRGAGKHGQQQSAYE